MGNIVIFLGDDQDGVRSHFDNVRLEAVSALDPDGDGIPAEWETGTDRGVPRNLDPNVNDGGLDFDGDTLTNFQEFQKGTHPRLADTDADGINDNAETVTDPLNPDSDGDTLLDGAEVTVGTNPNDTDSDDDAFEDQAETASGTNPLNPASKPTDAGEILVGLNFVGGNATSDGAQVTSQAGRYPQSNWNNAPGGSGGPVSLVNSAGAPTILRVAYKTNGPFIVGVEPPADDGNASMMHGILRPRGTAAVPAGDDVITEITLRNIAYEKYEVYLYLNSQAGGQAIFTANDKTVTVENILPFDGSFVLAGDGGEGNVVHFANLSGPTLTIRQTMESGGIAGLQFGRPLTDTDADGMPDAWELANQLNPAANDAALDKDSDGSTNLAEFQKGTNPGNNDTDNDGFLDGVETGTGTFVNVSNTGTDPLVADTDGDGLRDGVENNSGIFVDTTNPGTNPLVLDTDGDGFYDLEEVNLETSPVSANSQPQIPAPIGYWPMNDQDPVSTKDLSSGGNHGTLAGAEVYVAGHSGKAGDFAIQFNGIDTAVTTGVPLLDGLNAVTLSGFIKFSAAQAARTGLWGQNDVVEWGYSTATTIEAWTPTGGALQTPGGQLADDDWHHLALVDDGTSKLIYINGVRVASGATGVPTATGGGSFNIGGNGVADATGNWFNGVIDDVAVWDSALSAPFIRQLANQSLTPLGPPAPPSPPFAITNVQFNSANRELTLTFESVAGVRYAIDARGATGGWGEVGQVTASGPSTSFTEVIPANVDVRLYRVNRLP